MDTPATTISSKPCLREGLQLCLVLRTLQWRLSAGRDLPSGLHILLSGSDNIVIADSGSGNYYWCRPFQESPGRYRGQCNRTCISTFLR